MCYLYDADPFVVPRTTKISTANRKGKIFRLDAVCFTVDFVQRFCTPFAKQTKRVYIAFRFFSIIFLFCDAHDRFPFLQANLLVDPTGVTLHDLFPQTYTVPDDDEVADESD